MEDFVKEANMEILKKYDSEEFFVNKVNEDLHDFINRYLGIQDDDEDDYDYDDDNSSEDE